MMVPWALRAPRPPLQTARDSAWRPARRLLPRLRPSPQRVKVGGLLVARGRKEDDEPLARGELLLELRREARERSTRGLRGTRGLG
eukprot:93628-Prymnesium_polylepis.2